MNLPDTSPPHSLDAEKQVICAMLRHPQMIDDISAIVGVPDFYLDAHQRIAGAIQSLHIRRKPIELTSLFEKLKETDEITDIGGAQYLADIWGCAPTGANWKHYADIMIDTSIRRRVLHLIRESMRDMMDRVNPAMEQADSLVSKLHQVLMGRQTNEPTTLNDAIELVKDAINDRDIAERNGEKIKGMIRTGFDRLDNVLGGFRPGQLIIIAARPGGGKSALALNLVLHAIDEVPCLFFSQEMSKEELAAARWLLRHKPQFMRLQAHAQ